jgi:hypothetical protein
LILSRQTDSQAAHPFNKLSDWIEEGTMLLYSAASEQQSGERRIAQGDTVIVYERPDSMKSAAVTATGSFDNRFDHFSMKASQSCPSAVSVFGALIISV